MYSLNLMIRLARSLPMSPSFRGTGQSSLYARGCGSATNQYKIKVASRSDSSRHLYRTSVSPSGRRTGFFSYCRACCRSFANLREFAKDLYASPTTIPRTSAALARIHRRRASGQCPEVARGCSCESGIMVLKQQSQRQNKEHPIDATTQPSRSHPNRV